MTVYRSGSAVPVAVAAGPVVAGPVGVSLGHRELAEADHWILSLDPPPVWACTHLVREPFAHVAISLRSVAAELPAPEEHLTVAADLAVAGKGGRAVLFPGVGELVGTLTVAEVLDRSAIDAVEVLGAGVAPPEAILETGDFVRPVYRGGRLVLTTTPSVGDRLVPFESRNPTPCCTSH